MSKQWLRLLIILAVSLGAFALWDTFRTLSGLNSDFNYTITPVQPGLIPANLEKLLKADPDFSAKS